MAQLKYLIEKGVKELSIEELEEKLNALKKLRVIDAKGGEKKAKTPKSNIDKRYNDLLKSLSKEQLKTLLEKLEGENG